VDLEKSRVTVEGNDDSGGSDDNERWVDDRRRRHGSFGARETSAPPPRTQKPYHNDERTTPRLNHGARGRAWSISIGSRPTARVPRGAVGDLQTVPPRRLNGRVSCSLENRATNSTRVEGTARW
jgi:hypothetical protein